MSKNSGSDSKSGPSNFPNSGGPNRDDGDRDAHRDHGHGRPIQGTRGDDILTGTAGDDRIHGKGGDDALYGLGGDDRLHGGRGNDMLDGGEGGDRLKGGGGNDALAGGAGDDRLKGNSGGDTLDGGAGSDRVDGDSGDDVLVYVAGENAGAHDRYDGGSGRDTLRLVLTREEWMRDDVQADIARFLAHLDAHRRGEGHGHDDDGGHGHDGDHGTHKWFEFQAFDLDVRRIESLEVVVDGALLDPRDEPVDARDDAATSTEDGSVGGNVLANDLVPDLVREVALASGPAHGDLIFSPDGSFLYTPGAFFDSLAAGETAIESFTYVVSDADHDSDTASVTLSITGVNDAPVAAADGNGGDAIVESGVSPGNTPFAGDASASGNVLANDSDVDHGARLSVADAGEYRGTYGMLTLGADGSWTYLLDNADPDTEALAQGERAGEAFGYTVTDEHGAIDTELLSLSLTGTNDAPVIAPGGDSGAVTEDGALTASGRLTASDVDHGAFLRWSVDGGPVTQTADYLFSMDNFRIVRNAGLFFEDAFSDGNPPPAAPTFGDGVTPASYFLNGAFSESGGRLVIDGSRAAPTPSVGTPDPFVGENALLLSNINPADLARGLKIDDNFTVEGRFDLVIPERQREAYGIRLTDRHLGGGGTPPDQVGDDLLTLVVSRGTDGVVRVLLLELDFAADTTTVVSAAPLNPVAGEDQIALRLEHSAANPGMLHASFDMLAGGVVTRSIALSNVGHIFGAETPGDPGDDENWTRAQIVSWAPADQGGTLIGAHGTLSVDTNGQWTYTLNNGAANVQALAQGETATDSFTVRVTDEFGASDSQLVTVDITGTNDAPGITPIVAAGFVFEDGTQVALGQFGAEDVDHGARLTWSVDGGGRGTHGTLALTNNEGSWAYTLDNNAAQVQALAQGERVTERFSVRVTDEHGASDTEEVNVTVTGANDAPVAAADGNGGDAIVESGVNPGNTPFAGDASASGNVLANDSDVDHGARLSVADAGEYRGTYGMLTLGADGSWTYLLDNTDPDTEALAQGERASEAFGYTVADEHGAIDTELLSLSLTGTNDAPVIAPGGDSGAVTEDGVQTAGGRLLASDVDHGAVLAWTLAGGAPGAVPGYTFGSVDYTFTADQFDVTKNGDASWFNDDFGNGNPPPSGDFFPNGAPGSYFTSGSFLEAGGRAIMDDAGAGPTFSFLFTSVPFLGHFAALGTDISNDMNLGLKRDDDFTVAARFDLVVPDENGEAYGIRLTDFISSGPSAHPGDDVMELVVRRGDDGQVRVQFFERDFAAGTTTPYAATLLNAPAGADQIALKLSHQAANPGVVTASFEYLAGGAVVGSQAFGPTGRIFGTETPADAADDEVWTRGQIIAYSPGEVTGSSLAGLYGTLSINQNGVWTYSLDNASPLVQALAQGETVTDSFTAKVLDQFGAFDTQGIDITVSGTNDTPVAAPDDNGADAIVESGVNPGDTAFAGDPSASGNVLANDTDIDQGAVLRVANAGTYVGTYGTLTLGADGVWSYALDNADPDTDALAQGEGASETFAYTVTDEHGAIDTEILSLRLTGTNDAPVIAPGGESGAVTEDGVQTASGRLVATDADHGALLHWSVDGGTTPPGAESIIQDNGGNPFAGGFTPIPPGPGQTFTAEDVQISTIGFVYSNGAGAGDLPITINLYEGLGFSGPLIESVSFDPVPADFTGGFFVGWGDADFSSVTLTAGNVYTIQSVTNSGTWGMNGGPSFSPGPDYYPGGFALLTNFSGVTQPRHDFDMTFRVLVPEGGAPGAHGTLSINQNGAWTYSLDNGSPLVQALAQGEQVIDTFVATVLDEHGASDSETISVTVTGTNDAPAISSAPQSGAAIEIADGAPGENTATHSQSGAVAFADIDTPDTHTAAFAPQDAGYRGSFALATVDQAGDAVGWTFTVADAELDNLQAGQTLTQTYDVTIDDGHGGSAGQTVTITLTGTNDAPLIASNLQTTFDFENLSGGFQNGIFWSYPEVVEDGFRFNSINTAALTPNDPLQAAFGYNVPTESTTFFGANQDKPLTRLDGDLFDAISVDLDHLRTPAPGPVTFVGVHGDGSIVQASFAVDALHGLQTFDFGEQFTGLRELRVPGQLLVQYDNIVLSAPGSFSSIGSPQSASLAEIADGVAGENATIHSRAGVVMFHDVDTLDTHTAAFAPQGAGYRGSFALAPVDQAGDTVGWTFTVADAELDNLQAGQTLTQTYDVTIDDGHGGSALQTVAITLTGTNDAPVVADDSYATGEDVPEVFGAPGLLANDSDVDAGAQLQVNAGTITSTLGATVVLNPDGSFSYDARNAAALQALDDGEFADDTFTYTATDGLADSTPATVTVRVSGATDNHAPVALDDTLAGSGGPATLVSQTLWGGASDQRFHDLDYGLGRIWLAAEANIGINQSLGVAYDERNLVSPVLVRPWSASGNSEAFFDVAARPGAPEAVFAGMSFATTFDGVGGKEAKADLLDMDFGGGVRWFRQADIAGSDAMYAYTGVEAFQGIAASVEGGNTYYYAAGGGQPYSYFAMAVMKFDAGGNTVAATPDPSLRSFSPGFFSTGGSNAYDVAVAGGSVYVAASTGWVAQGDPSGRPNLLTYDTGLRLLNNVKDASLFGNFSGLTTLNGEVYAVGQSNDSVGMRADYLIEKFDRSGNFLWRMVSGTAGEDSLQDVVAMGGRLFATGYTNGEGAGGYDVVLAEIDPATGAILSKTLFGGANDDRGWGISTDGTNLFIAGESRSFTLGGNGAGQNDGLLLKYAPSQGFLEDTPITVNPASLLANDSDADGDALAVIAVGGAQHGSVAFSGGSIVFTPEADYNGPASFTYTVSDGRGGTDDATVSFNITAVNDAPVALNSLIATNAGTPVQFVPSAFDPETPSGSLSYTLVSGPSHGFLNGSGTNLTYTPNAGYSGPDSFTFQATDPQGASSGIATVSIDIAATAFTSGAEFRVNTYTQGFQSTDGWRGAPTVASLADGGFVATWISYFQDGSEYGVFGQRYDANGSPAGGEFRLSTVTANHQIWSSVAGLANGGFVATWSSLGQDGSGYGVFGQRYDANGSPAGSEFRLNAYTSSDQIYPSLAGLANGGFVAAWSSLGQDGSGYGIYGQRYDASGNPAGSEFRLNSSTISDQFTPSVAGLPNGGFVATWNSIGQDGSGYGVFGQRYDASGSPVGAEFRLNTYSSSDQIYPSVSGLADGGYVAGWSSFLQDGSGWGVFGQRYDASGSPVGAEFRLNTYTSSDQIYPSVAGLPNGGFVATWSSWVQDGSGWGVFGQRYDVSGSPVDGEFRLNSTTSSEQIYVDVAAFRDGDFAAIWSSYGQDGSEWGVFGRLFQDGGGAKNLVGGSGNDSFIGSSAADTFTGNGGSDRLTGLAGADRFIFRNAGDGTDTITDFNRAEGDVLNIRDVLSGYEPGSSLLSDFVQLRESGGSTTVEVDANGKLGGASFTPLATLQGVTGLVLDDLLANGNLIVS